MSPDEMLQQLKKRANKQKKRNLELIDNICKEQHERGSKDFSIAMIGKLSEQEGGPKSQSIRNKGGEDFRAIILNWAKHTGGTHVKVATKKKINTLYGLLSKIARPDVRAVFTTVLTENQQLRSQIDILRKYIKKHKADLIIDRRSREVKPSKEQVFYIPPINDLTNSEIQALKISASDTFFKDQGWLVEKNGRVLNSKGRSIYKAGYVTAIKKVLSIIDNGGSQLDSR